MSRRVALAAYLGTLALTTPAFAHHPGTGGNTGGGGPIITIPATTLEQGHFAVAVWYEYVRHRELSDAVLIDAASKHIHAHSLKSVESAVGAFAYGITNDLMISLRVPINRRTGIREGHHEHVHGGGVLNTVDLRGDSTGVGDVTVLGQYRFLNNIATQTEAALLFGVKAPTGTTNLFDQNGELFETEFQPGSGSWDWLVGGAFTQRVGNWSFDANVLYIGAGDGAQQTNLGDRFLYNAGVSYRLIGALGGPRHAYAHAGHQHRAPVGKAPRVAPPPSWSLDAILELNGEWHDKQEIGGVLDDNSGGHVLYLAPGLRASYDRFSGFVSVGFPIVNEVNGLQSKPDYRVLSGMSFTW